ncbi:hypothetical protein ACFWNG_18440 [Streptomyces sp. NPDC058391]|uniref:hypothetical protein n=1 Tax=Streptomyces sp. NPDC058391 TaxID=3346476 RepID=UPI003664958B
MARNYDDDAARQQRDANERIHVMNSNLVLSARENLARRQLLDRVWHAGWLVSWLSLLTAIVGTVTVAVTTGDPSRFALGVLICASVLLMSLLALVGVHFAGRGVPSRQRAEADLASFQESLWKSKARDRPKLGDRRMLYREEVTTAIEQYQADSRKYRRIHNSLQTLIMIGSAATTTIAALDTGKN